MKKSLQIIAVIAALAIAGYAISRALASDETRIRWLIEATIEAFNDSRVGGTIEGLAEEFREETAKLGRDEVKLILLHLFLQERDPQTKDFRFKVVPADKLAGREMELKVKFDPASPLKASLTLAVAFCKMQGEAAGPAWTIEVDASLEKKDDGWKVVTSRHKTLSGKRPF